MWCKLQQQPQQHPHPACGRHQTRAVNFVIIQWPADRGPRRLHNALFCGAVISGQPRAAVTLDQHCPQLTEALPTYSSSNVINSPPIGECSIVMSVSGCVSVCLSVSDHIFGTARPIFIKLVVDVTYGRDSVLLRRRRDTSCTARNICSQAKVARRRRPTEAQLHTQPWAWL